MPVGSSEYRFAEKPRTSGFTPLANGLLWDSSLSPAARLLYAMFYDLATFTHERPTQRELAEKLCCTEKTLRAHISELVAAGLVEVTRPSRSRNVYTVFTLDNRAEVEEEVSGKNYRSDKGEKLPLVSGKNYRSTRTRDSLSEKTEEKTETPAESLVIDGVVAAVPKLVKVDGRNLGFDALKDATGAGAGEDRKVASALNGKGKQPGIRAFFAAEHPLTPDYDPEDWERNLAGEIYRRAVRYGEVMPPDSLLTPTALCAWWGRLGSDAPRRRNGMTAQDRAAIPDAVEMLRRKLG